jgi:isopentenyl-diphosphate Delta-isomerase
VDNQLLKDNEVIEYIITVDEQDRETGALEKLEVHRRGILHRAFSVVIFNHQGEMLLQKRAKIKYHSPGLWSNTCCSHQRVGETLKEAVSRRIQEELGFVCDCKEMFHFIYRVEFDNGLIEHEIDHVFLGYYNGIVIPKKEEVEEIQWINLDKLSKDMKEHPQRFTYWFRILMEQPDMLSKEIQVAEDK